MKQIVALMVLLVFSVGVHTKASSQTVYNIGLRGLDNDSIALQSYSGKKILFVVLPLSNDSLANQLKAFAGAVHQVKVIGILSVDDGYSNALKDSIKAIYASSAITLTEGLNTHKGGSQSLFMQWLTDYTKNGHFNKDAVGIGTKFFVNEKGGLYACLGPATPLNSAAIAKAINAPAAQ